MIESHTHETAAAPPEPNVQFEELARIARDIDRHVAEHEVIRARQLVDEALARWPDVLGAMLADGRVKEAEGQADAAAAVYQHAADTFTISPAPLAALARLHLKAGAFADARTAYDLARERGLTGAQAFNLEMALARGQQDWTAVRRAADALVAGGEVPTNGTLGSLAAACRFLGDVPGAERAGAALLERDPDFIPARHTMIWAALERGDGEEALTHWRHLASLAPDDSRFMVKAIRLLGLLGRPGEAARELAAAVRRWPNDPLLRLYLMRASPSAHWLEAILGQSGPHTQSAISRQVAAEAASLQRLWRLAPTDSSLARPIITDDVEREVLVGAAQPGRPAVLVFTGLHDQVGIPVGVFDRYLAALGVSGIYLRDFKRLLFLDGISSLADDYAGTVAALWALVRSLGASRICTIGVSGGGGIASVHYGLELDADHVISFAGDTHRRQGEITRMNDLDLKVVAARVRQNLPPAMLDLRPILRERSSAPVINLVYGEQSEADREQATYLADCPGVRLHALAGVSEHMVIRKMAARPGFLDFLASGLGLASPA